MFFNIFVSKKSAKLLEKLDDDVQQMLQAFYRVNTIYEKKVNLLQKYVQTENKGEPVWGTKALQNELSKLLRDIGLEKKVEKKEDVYACKALDHVQELLSRWKNNKKLVRLTYQEFSDLSILHESLRNIISLLQKQKDCLAYMLAKPQYLSQRMKEFKDLVWKESVIIKKEKEFLLKIKSEQKNIEEAHTTEFSYSLVGYGSLLNAEETMNELKATLEKAGTRISNLNTEFKKRVTPVWVVGFKRVFNMIATREVWIKGEDVKANRATVLNVAPSLNNRFNAVAIKLTDDEFEAIKRREKNMRLQRLKNVYDYRTGEKLQEECVCVKSNQFRQDPPVDKSERRRFYGERIRKFAYGLDPDKLIKSNKMPIPRYIEVIDTGVRKLDKLLGTVGMYDNYLNTSYCYYIDREEKRDYGEIRLLEYYKLVGKKIERRQQISI